MKLKRRAKRQTPETIIALIDVVFFLLVFFMLIGRMDATAPFEVTPAQASTGADMPSGGSTISIGASGEISLDAVAVSLSDMMDAVETILAENPEMLIRINAHREALLGTVLPMVGELETLGARDVVLVVTPEAL